MVMSHLTGGRAEFGFGVVDSPGRARQAILMDPDGEIACGGWRIAAGFAGGAAPRNSANFYAVYAGDSFGHPRRGIIAAMARAHPETAAHVFGARESAQLVVHSLAEGYFGARRTLSSRRAAGVALTAINRWLFGQARTDTASHLAPVSVAALMFSGGQVGIAQIGACLIYRYRAKKLVPLMRDHIRPLPDGGIAPTRAVGLDLELSVDYDEEPAAADDRYIIVSGFETANHDAVYTTLAERLNGGALAAGPLAETLLAAFGNAAGHDKSAMVLDVVATPPLDGDAAAQALADLPLRPAPREGDLWDGYRIGKTLYRGRYTMVKSAYDTIENHDVALKIPLPAMLQDEIFTAGFMREAWIGTTVRGAHIARYLDPGPERRGSLYLVMPLYQGETLEARLRRAPPISLPDGLGIALKICEAVQDLAAIQIIHRDIKPDNIMLLPDNDIRLLDLGLAYLPGIDQTEAVKPGGTLRYMAPELFRGGQANARSEVFALGVTIYRSFSGGAFPFGQHEPLPLARMRPDLPSWLGRILQRAIASEPAARFADAGELAAALQQALVTGTEDGTARRGGFSTLPALRLWQAAAGIFAIGFLLLLFRTLR
jgi:hypothetical protein